MEVLKELKGRKEALNVKIVIAGGGKVGETLCRELSLENNDVILIEKNNGDLSV